MSESTGERASRVQRVQDHIGREFTTNTWVIIPVGAALGTAGGVFTQTLRLPIFLDALGTVLVAILAGPWPALITGLLTNVLEGVIINPTYFAYSPVNMAFGLVAGYLFLGGWAKSYAKLFGVGLAVAATAVVTGAPITAFLFGGVTGSGTDAVVAFFLATGNNILTSVLATTFIFEPIDKEITVFLAYFIAKSIPERYRPAVGQEILPEDQDLV
jgi:energy-coupling factor transport system substrate-specific component